MDSQLIRSKIGTQARTGSIWSSPFKHQRAPRVLHANLCSLQLRLELYVSLPYNQRHKRPGRWHNRTRRAHLPPGRLRLLLSGKGNTSRRSYAQRQRTRLQRRWPGLWHNKARRRDWQPRTQRQQLFDKHCSLSLQLWSRG